MADISVAAKEATPATTVVAYVNFCPVPPSDMATVSEWESGGRGKRGPPSWQSGGKLRLVANAGIFRSWRSKAEMM